MAHDGMLARYSCNLAINDDKIVCGKKISMQNVNSVFQGAF